MLLRRADPLLPFQALAVVPHPRLRLLLSDVGNHVPRPTTPFDRAEAVRPEGELRARVGEGITVLKSVRADAETRRRGKSCRRAANCTSTCCSTSFTLLALGKYRVQIFEMRGFRWTVVYTWEMQACRTERFRPGTFWAEPSRYNAFL